MEKFLKRIMKIIICFAIVLDIGSMPVFASEINISGTSLSWSFENSVLTISGTGAMADYDGTNVYGPWYSVSPSIKKIVIRDGVTHIGNCAFQSCYNATSVEIASSVKTIGEWAFANCDGFTSVDIPYGVETIGRSAFRSCDGLSSINIPFTVTEIGNLAFDSTNLTNVRVPAGCIPSGEDSMSIFDNGTAVIYYGSCGTNISWELNESTGALTLSGTGAMVEFQQSQEGIATPWNQYSSKIKSLVIGDGITTISIGAFYNCSNLTSITFGSGLKTIEIQAFGMTGLTSVNIPGNVTTIGMYAFYSCVSLANITLAEGVETIGDAAFAGCGSKNVVIPASVTSVGGSALGGGKFETIYNLSKMVLKNTSYSSDTTRDIFASVYSPLSVGEGVNITCGETQSYNGNILYKAGSVITLTPESNKEISNVTVNSEVIEASEEIYSFSMPAGVTSVVFTLTELTQDCPVTYRGAQMRTNTNGTYDIRLIATIDTLDSDAVGFLFSKSETNPTKENVPSSQIMSSTKVYNSVTAMGEKITAVDLGGTYIIACTVKNIPTAAADTPLYVRAFATKGTETTYTEVKTVTVNSLLP